MTLNLGHSSSRYRGQRRYFELTSSHTLSVSVLGNCYCRNSQATGQVGFVECTQFTSTGIPRNERKNAIAYSINGDKSAYHLGWVVSLVYTDHVDSTKDVLKVYR